MKGEYWLVAAALILFLVALTFSYFPQTNRPPENKLESSPAVSEQLSQYDGEAHSPDSNRPRVAIVIDDLGWELGTIPLYEQVPAPLTMALMPERPHSDYHYQLWRDKYEFIIHMPMEPLGYPDDDPGEHALMTGMNRSEVINKIEKVVELYPSMVGMNNHMGSAFVRHQPGMEAVMAALSKHDMFYLDSRTDDASVAAETARKHGVPVEESDVFLDGQTDKEHIRGQFKELMEVAKTRGEAIAIGHIQTPNTARVLYEMVPKYKQKGIEFVYLSELFDLSPLRRRIFTSTN